MLSTSKLLMTSSRCLKRCVLRCFVPMSAWLLSVEMKYLEICRSDTSSQM